MSISHFKGNKTIQIQRIVNKFMQQSALRNSSNEFAPVKAPFLKILQCQLKQNQNHADIKSTVLRKLQKIEVLTYSAIVDDESGYLKSYGKDACEEGLFDYIGSLIANENSTFHDRIIFQNIAVKSNLKAPPEPEPQPDPQLMQEVENVLNNVDLPLSLFKRNDNYWSIDNPKTLETNDYLKKRHQEDRQFKREFNKKRQKIIQEKQKVQNQTIDVIRQQEDHKKEQMKQRIQKKIESLKQNAESRKRSISHSVQFMRERGKPLCQKIQNEFRQKVELPSLEEKKKKLFELRQLKRSVPIEEIQSHRDRYAKIKSEHQTKSIFNEAPKVGFKSHFYESIASSRTISEMSNNVSLYQKKLQYSRLVKENFKPAIDQQKAQQMQEKIQASQKKRVRRKNLKRSQNEDDDDSDENTPEPSEESQPEPSEQEQEDSDSDKQRPPKDDQYEPDNKERYKMGVNYLKVARSLAKKQMGRKDVDNTTLQNKSQDDNGTIDFSMTHGQGAGQVTVQPQTKKEKFVWVSKYDEEPKKEERIQYKNYLHEMQKRSSTPVNGIDTSRVKQALERPYETSRVHPKGRQIPSDKDISAEIMYQTNLENKIRNVEEKAQYQEQLLKFKKVNRSAKIQKTMAIDDAVVDTIKARLSLMGGHSN